MDEPKGVNLRAWIDVSSYSFHTASRLDALVEMLSLLLNTDLIMRRNPGDHFSLVDGTGVANHPHAGVGLSENGTNRSHLYFQSVMSFPCVLTNPLHQHLSHGEEGVQRKMAENRPKNILFFFYAVYIF